MRLDYALLSPALAASCEVTSRLVRDAETERLHRALQEALDADPGPGTEVAVQAPDA